MAQQRPHGTRRVWLPAAAFGLFAAAIGVRLVQLQRLADDCLEHLQVLAWP